ncbi:MAG: DUF3837 family protein [Eubacteriales bacterium]|nr:DUF3837 family protein [Eubacteriales bacterium]
MVFSIVKQSLDIRLGFPHTPKISADTECAAGIGMLAKLYGLPVPERQAELTDMRQSLADQASSLPKTPKIEKLEEMLYRYEPKAPMDDEKYELLVYAYKETTL